MVCGENEGNWYVWRDVHDRLLFDRKTATGQCIPGASGSLTADNLFSH